MKLSTQMYIRVYIRVFSTFFGGARANLYILYVCLSLYADLLREEWIASFKASVFRPIV